MIPTGLQGRRMNIRGFVVSSVLLMLLCSTAQAAEIHALGSSASHCEGVDHEHWPDGSAWAGSELIPSNQHTVILSFF